MACQYFGPYDPQKQPPDTIPKWIASCASSGGEFPKACLNPDGTYDLYCCTEAGDYPCKEHSGVTICLPGEVALELHEKGEVRLFDGLGSIRYPHRHHKKHGDHKHGDDT